MAKNGMARSSEYRAKKIAEGLCLMCNEVPVAGKRHCLRHLEYRSIVSSRYNFFNRNKRNEYIRKWRASRRKGASSEGLGQVGG